MSVSVTLSGSIFSTSAATFLSQTRTATFGIEVPDLAAENVSGAVQVRRAQREVGKRLERDGARAVSAGRLEHALGGARGVLAFLLHRLERVIWPSALKELDPSLH